MEDRAAPRALFESDTAWVAIAAALDEGIALARPGDGVIVWCNASFAALVGRAADDVVGTALTVLVASGESTVSVLGDDEWTGELRVLGRDAVHGSLEARAFTVGGGADVPLRAVVVRSDAKITGRAADLAQFASVAAHDLRSPLQAAMGFAELLGGLDSVVADPVAAEYSTLLLRSINRMHALVDDLLAYLRVGAAPGGRSAVDTAALFAETVEAHEGEIAETGAVVTCDDLPVVTGDTGLVFVVLSNLLSNALKFHAGGVTPRVHVGVENHDGEWHFTVSDNGIGIDPRFRERAFDMFRRLHGSEEYPGTGMGLAICKRAVESLNGRIWAEPNKGGGTRMCFTLPARRGAH